MVALIILWLVVLHPWLLYPATMAVLARFAAKRRRQDTTGAPYPSITILVTVYNAATYIRAKIANCLALDYPADRLQILIASDGSTDNTLEIVREYADRGVEMFACGRVGKTLCQNQAWQVTRGDVVLFTDGESVLPQNALKEITSEFEDSRVGAVGASWFPEAPRGDLGRHESAYWRFENHLRKCESDVGILAVLAGACMAIRRSYFRPMPPDSGEDCVLPLMVRSQGGQCRHVLVPVFDEGRTGLRQELRIRTRMTLRNWIGTLRYPTLLNPFRHPFIAFALISHKLLRWLTPLLAMALLAVALREHASLAGNLTVFGILGFLACAMIGLVLNVRGISVPGISTAASFLVVNVGFFLGTVKALLGQRIMLYAPSTAPAPARQTPPSSATHEVGGETT